MSITNLIEKYDVSTEDGYRQALSEIEHEEAEVHSALEAIVQRHCHLGGKLRAVSRAYSSLARVQSDAVRLSDMVQHTSALADSVSTKVRRLDLARSRVAECQRRVHDLVDLQLCARGVEAAIRDHNYETAAAHVARFLAMEPSSLEAARARGADQSQATMTKAVTHLRQQVTQRFEEAARKDEAAAVERFFKIFPLLGLHDEGVTLLATYIAEPLGAANKRWLPGGAELRAEEPTLFADAFTRLLEAGCAAVERLRAACVSGGAGGRLAHGLRALQPPVCAAAKRLAGELARVRRLPPAPRDPRRTAAGAPPPDPLTLDPLLSELAMVHSRVHMYFQFLRRKVQSDCEGLETAARAQQTQALEQLILDCDLTRTAQVLLGHYLSIERYFLEESVAKALRLAAPADGQLTSSLVDDVFFIARKCIRRAVSTGSVDGACAILNECGARLEGDTCEALRRALRSPPPPPPEVAALPSAAAATAAALDLPAALGARLSRDHDAQRAIFFAHLNDAEIGGEYVERLVESARREAEAALGASDKLASCAAALAGAAAAFRAAHELGVAALRAALRPRVESWADAAAARAGERRDDELADEEEADATPARLEELASYLRERVAPRACDAVLAALLADLTRRWEKHILATTYNRVGGLALERCARRLAAWAGGGGAGGARERCTRLTQLAALVALEAVSDAPDALRPQPRLAPHEVRLALARRSDFRLEDIKRLKL